MGLTHPQYLVMLALWQHAPLSVRRLSELLQLDPGTLSPLLKRLEAIGYLRRERDRSDERSLAITLTPQGRELRARAEKIPPAVVERLGMPIEELRSLHAALTQVIAAAKPAPGPVWLLQRRHSGRPNVGAASPCRPPPAVRACRWTRRPS